MDENHRKAISKSLKGHYVSEETKRKIGIANKGVWHSVRCSFCSKEKNIQDKVFKRYKTFFCGRDCYAKYRKTLPREAQNAYRGVLKNGDPKWLYSARYRKSHPDRIAHLKARRYARERNAEGSHTFEEWIELCRRHKWRCVHCHRRRKLTKDHIKPLSLGGTDYIMNIQPLCRSCNSRKWRKFNIYQNPELLAN